MRYEISRRDDDEENQEEHGNVHLWELQALEALGSEENNNEESAEEVVEHVKK